jgi:von Willebrand factor type A domain
MTAHTMGLSGCALVLAICVGRAFGEAPANKESVKKEPKPQVEVVFCLDTTGSMGGLIDAAKQKIWTIANQIASGKPTPRLKIGLVAYRDRGDQYITRIFDLTDDLDAVYAHLMEFRAEGGGDAPESVNQALLESVATINWSADKKTLKIVFLVGDAPPHLDYANDVQYPETCRRAVEKRIIINTVQCGNDRQT